MTRQRKLRFVLHYVATFAVVQCIIGLGALFYVDLRSLFGNPPNFVLYWAVGVFALAALVGWLYQKVSR